MPGARSGVWHAEVQPRRHVHVPRAQLLLPAEQAEQVTAESVGEQRLVVPRVTAVRSDGLHGQDGNRAVASRNCQSHHQPGRGAAVRRVWTQGGEPSLIRTWNPTGP